MLLDFAAYIGLLILICIGLAKSADLVEAALVFLCNEFGINQFIAGFFILSLASSLPEIMLMFTSAGTQAAALSAGNLLGGIIILLTLVVGIDVIRYKRIPFKGHFGLKQLFLALLVLLTSLVCLLDGSVSAIEGLIMLGTYSIYMFYLIVFEMHKFKHQPHTLATIDRQDTVKRILKAMLGLILLLVLARLAVDVAVKTGEMAMIPKSIIGLIVLALGTNLPEITIALRSSKESRSLAIGNVFGSATINAAILGVLGLISPFTIGNGSLIPAIVLIAIIILYLAIAAMTGAEIRRKEAIFLFGLYGLMIVVEFGLLVIG